MKKKNYPASLFLIGVVMNLMSFFPLLLIAIILFVVRIFVSSLSIRVPVVFGALWILAAFNFIRWSFKFILAWDYDGSGGLIGQMYV